MLLQKCFRQQTKTKLKSSCREGELDHQRQEAPSSGDHEYQWNTSWQFLYFGLPEEAKGDHIRPHGPTVHQEADNGRISSTENVSRC